MSSLENRRKNKVLDERLLKPSDPFEGPVGSLVWGKLKSYPWWPGIIVDGQDCGMSDNPPGYFWIFWFEDCRVSGVQNKWMKDFKEHYTLCFDPNRNHKTYVSGVVQAVKLCAERLGHKAESWTNKHALCWAQAGFQQSDDRKVEEVAPIFVPDVVRDDLETIKDYRESNQQNESSQNCGSSTETSSSKPSFQSDDLKKVKNGEMDIKNLCLRCRSSKVQIVGEHPYFEGSLCKICMETVKECIFAFGDDGIHTHCAICCNEGQVFICSKLGCYRVYCHDCIDLLAAEGAKKWIHEEEPWLCFLCDPSPSFCGIIKPRPDWMNYERITALFSVNNFMPVITPPRRRKSALRVLSLFDGISTGMVVLKMMEMKVKKYYASEVDEDAINVSKANHGNTIEHIGDIERLSFKKLSRLGPIDLLLGGSPCTDLSLVNPARKGLYDTNGSGYLFFDFYRVLMSLQVLHGNCTFWMYENTASMPCSYRDIITRFLGCDPVVIDASWLSAQHRARFFWGNIPGLGRTVLPKIITLDEYLIQGMERIAAVDKINTVTTRSNSLLQGKNKIFPVKMNGNGDTLWMTELENIFGLPIHYTDTGNLQLSKRRQLLGRAWSVPVVKHILQPLRSFFKCEGKMEDSDYIIKSKKVKLSRYTPWRHMGKRKVARIT